MSKQPTPADMASWPAPNYVNPETRRPLVFGVEIPLMVLITIFTSLRFYSRLTIVRKIGTDDWFILAATITALATSIMTCISMGPAYQTGYHLWDVRLEILLNPKKTYQIAMATQLIYVPLTMMTKISILFTYLSIFPSRTNKYFCYGNLALTVVWGLFSFFVALFQCSPVQSYWEQAKYPNRKCIDIGILFYVSGGVNVFTDFLIYLWPAKDLWQVKISLKQRVTLISMFSLGVIICVAGVVRLWYASIFLNSYDQLWHGATLYVIIAVETSIGIVCGCLPACKPLMSQLLPKVFGSTAASGNRSTHKKNSKGGSKSFPFQSLSDGHITKEEGYSVEYSSHSRGKGDGTPRVNVEVGRPRRQEKDADALSAESQEWIMMQDSPKGYGERKNPV